MEKNSVYILDNNEEYREKLKDILKENFDILGESSDGEKALNEIQELKPDIVIGDIVLQTYDTYELLEKLKENEKLEKTKFIIISSLKGDEFAQKAIDLGAKYYMVKPVAKDVLLKRINELILLESEENKIFTIKNSKNRALDEKISNVFITVGIPAHIKGYQFLREAIKMAIDEPNIINSITKQLYPSIATRFSTSASKVERAIRHAIEVAWNRGKIENINSLFGIKVYNSNEKPTNGEFIALVADKMLIEGA